MRYPSSTPSCPRGGAPPPRSIVHSSNKISNKSASRADTPSRSPRTMPLPSTIIIPTPGQGGLGSRGVQIVDPVAEDDLVLSTHSRRTIAVRVEDWDTYCAARQLPDDAGVWIERLSIVVTGHRLAGCEAHVALPQPCSRASLQPEDGLRRGVRRPRVARQADYCRRGAVALRLWHRARWLVDRHTRGTFAVPSVSFVCGSW